MVFFGAFGAGRPSLAPTDAAHAAFNHHQIVVVIGLWGVVMSAVYKLRAYRRIFLGEAREQPTGATRPALTDLFGSQRWALILLIVSLLVVGFQPSVLVDAVRPALQAGLPDGFPETAVTSADAKLVPMPAGQLGN
jgi:NADH-quinone oxidoreductase subunit M